MKLTKTATSSRKSKQFSICQRNWISNQNIPKKKTPGSDSLTGELLKKEKSPHFYTKEESLLNLFNDTSPTLTPKLEKDITPQNKTKQNKPDWYLSWIM